MLILKKFGYSAAPWRLCQLVNGQARELRLAEGLWWDRKRDALPVFTSLLALGLPWTTPIREWPVEALRQLGRRIASLPCVQAEYAALETQHQSISRVRA